ncbi:MAG TPA: hypothetical protein VFV49_17840, partial [Thermoanaerobaculia bacterium]|nr:hypothetical protein [Thermoanaerobaculia bacterium]
NLPILMLPAMDVPVPSGGTVLAAIRDALLAWMTANAPSRQDGGFRFDMSVYSSLSDDRLPLIRMRNLRLAVTDVSDL